MSTPVGDLTRENLLTLAQAARRFPPARRGRPLTPSAIWRWCRKGIRVPGVGTVYLECVRVAGLWLTSAEALCRFATRQTPPTEDNPPPPPRSPGRRQRASKRATEELRRQGI